jgi:hypothetical protein
MRGWLTMAAFAIAVTCPIIAFPAGQTFYHGVFQNDDAFMSFVEIPDGGIYERQRFPWVTGVITVTWSTFHGLPPEFGNRWRIEKFDEDSEESLGWLEIQVRDSADFDLCLWGRSDISDWEILGCAFEPFQFNFFGAFHSECIDETLHRMRSSILAASGEDHIDSGFEPTSYYPAVANIVSDRDRIGVKRPADSLLPGYPIPEFPGGVATIMVNVQDSTGCEIPLEDAEVKLRSTIVAGSGGHVHFSGDETRGGGNFSTLRDGSHTSDDGTEIDGPTDEFGTFSALYVAGELGVEERIRAIASRQTETPSGVAESEELETRITTSFGGLVDFTDGLWESLGPPSPGAGRRSPPHPEHGFDIAYGGSCPHQPPAVWVRPVVRTKIINLNEEYHAAYGSSLSFNDASLQLGGKIEDLGKGGRNARCHISHRAGIDIDINGRDRGDVNIWEAVDTNGVPRFESLRDLASQHDLYLVASGGIHFRWIEGSSDGG